MKELSVISFNIGNLIIRISMQNFALVGNKKGTRTHAHGDYEYHFVMEGTSKIKVDGVVSDLTENQAVIIAPDTFHKFICEDDNAKILSITFSIKKSSRGASYFNVIDNALIKKGYILLPHSKQVADLLYGFISTIYSKNALSFEEMRAYLTIIFVKIFSFISSDFSSDENPYSAKDYDLRTYAIDEFFNLHYMENLSIKKLAKILNLSEKQTERTVKQIYGVTFKQKLTEKRINVAKDLLFETENSINKIAELVGYSSYNGFYSAFVKVVGFSPEQWKNSQKL